MNSTMENSSEINLPQLPESCISDILSFTTPRDLCRLSAVSRLFTSAADGDSLWNKFIPQQSHQILPRAVTPVAFASRRELYFHLCNSILIDRGTQVYIHIISLSIVSIIIHSETLVLVARFG